MKKFEDKAESCRNSILIKSMTPKNLKMSKWLLIKFIRRNASNALKPMQGQQKFSSSHDDFLYALLEC